MGVSLALLAPVGPTPHPVPHSLPSGGRNRSLTGKSWLSECDWDPADLDRELGAPEQNQVHPPGPGGPLSAVGWPSPPHIWLLRDMVGGCVLGVQALPAGWPRAPKPGQCRASARHTHGSQFSGGGLDLAPHPVPQHRWERPVSKTQGQHSCSGRKDMGPRSDGDTCTLHPVCWAPPSPACVTGLPTSQWSVLRASAAALLIPNCQGPLPTGKPTETTWPLEDKKEGFHGK